MKYIILIFCLLLTTSVVVAQSKKANKVGAEVQKKIESTPVGFFKKGKLVVNQKVLNPKVCSGEKITSYEIIKSKKMKSHFLLRRAKLKKGYLTSFIPLKIIENKLFVNQTSGNYMVDCFSDTCSSCVESISDTGSAFCECPGGESSFCTDYDHCPESEIIGSVFL